jgi:dipeptidyl aminopeptidase/acylaminoacyl peptidase
MRKAVSFFSEGIRLSGDLYLPDDLGSGEKRAGIVLCHGYTGVRNIYLPDNARVLTEAGYVVLNFDYKGWGDSDGPKTRLAPYSRVADVQAALTYMAAQPEVEASRLGIYGTSYGGATVVWVAAVDPRVKCTVSVVGIGNGARWMRSVRRPDEYYDLLERSAVDRARRALEGTSEFVERPEILLPDRQSVELGMAARRNNPAAVTAIPLEFVDDTLSFNPEWVVDRIAPRPVLFITSDNDRLVPPAESEALFARAGEPKKLVTLKGYGHYEVYEGEAFRQVMAAATDWYRQHLPAR